MDVLLRQTRNEDIFRYAAGGFADFSRLASSDPLMWADIFRANAGPVEAVLNTYIKDLKDFKKTLRKKDHAAMMTKFNRSRRGREGFLRKYLNEGDPKPPAEELIYKVQPGGSVRGALRLPGDKSISHRAVILGAIADGVTQVRGFLEGDDSLRTVAALREMGVTITGPERGCLTIYGVGRHGLQPPRRPLDMGNSGTAMRLLAGLLAAQPFAATLTGDESLSQRPMARIAEPLKLMGASIETDGQGTPPLVINASPLKAINYPLPVASAQLKSCLLLAGLYADGQTEITEPAICRDHTERMLTGFGYPIERDIKQGVCRLTGGHPLRAADIDIPADISAAAFFMVAAAITPGAELTLRHVGVNPTRSGIITLLRLMGCDIRLHNEAEAGGEPVADISVTHSPLQGIEIPQEQVASAIDEFPALFIAAACAEGETVLRGAEELRVKESDRIEAMAAGLRTLGVRLETYPDGIRIQGGPLGGGEVDSRGDHRIAMSFAVAALRATAPVRIRHCNNVSTSFPGFPDTARAAGLRIQEAAT